MVNGFARNGCVRRDAEVFTSARKLWYTSLLRYLVVSHHTATHHDHHDHILHPLIIMATPRAATAVNILTPTHAAGLQSLLSKLYSKPVELHLTKLRRPHLSAEILSSVVVQKLKDRKSTPRRVIRDAAWKAQLPTARSVTALTQAKLARPVSVSSRAIERGSAFGPLRPQTAKVLKQLCLSQVSSVRVEAAGRLSKRITANRSQRKVAGRGATTKLPAYMVRGFRKRHVDVMVRAGKRRIGSYGVRVDLGHS
jgi:hypothetical protein